MQLQCFVRIQPLPMSVNFASHICNENINKSLDGAYLVDFGIDITQERKISQKNSILRDVKSY